MAKIPPATGPSVFKPKKARVAGRTAAPTAAPTTGPTAAPLEAPFLFSSPNSLSSKVISRKFEGISAFLLGPSSYLKLPSLLFLTIYLYSIVPVSKMTASDVHGEYLSGI